MSAIVDDDARKAVGKLHAGMTVDDCTLILMTVQIGLLDKILQHLKTSDPHPLAVKLGLGREA